MKEPKEILNVQLFKDFDTNTYCANFIRHAENRSTIRDGYPRYNGVWLESEISSEDKDTILKILIKKVNDRDGLLGDSLENILKEW